MNFQSILYRRIEPGLATEQAEAPEFFSDLNLDQIVAAATAGRDEYDLKPFFYRPLDDADDIAYRHEVMKDLEEPRSLEGIRSFARKMQDMRRQLAQADKFYYRRQKEASFIDAVAVYCNAIRRLIADLDETQPESRGFCGFREYLAGYVRGQFFRDLTADTERISVDLRAVRYCFSIHGAAVTVRKYDGEIDYGSEIEQTFEKFRQGDTKNYSAQFPEYPEMNHVEAQILDQVAKLHPDIFSRLTEFRSQYYDFIDPLVQRFDREVQFYVSYLDYVAGLKREGLAFCYPSVSRRTKAVRAWGVFDLALATKLATENAAVVANDFYLDGRERIFVVSGPNQGGKTTFARTFGQLHYLASLGCPVPGSNGRLFLFDHLFTHFEREENIDNLRGKLQGDLVRIHQILSDATPNSLVIMNELFSSTALDDAVFLATRIMDRIVELDCLGVCVSFLEELASLGDSVVSMVSTVTPENPAQRTFRVIRRPADGRAYAISIAEKYRLTYRSLKQRIAS